MAGRFVKRDGELIVADVGRAVRLAQEASERVLGGVTSEHPLLPPAPEGFADALNTLAAQHLARAWAIEPS